MPRIAEYLLENGILVCQQPLDIRISHFDILGQATANVLRAVYGLPHLRRQLGPQSEIHNCLFDLPSSKTERFESINSLTDFRIHSKDVHGYGKGDEQ